MAVDTKGKGKASEQDVKDSKGKGKLVEPLDDDEEDEEDFDEEVNILKLLTWS